MNYIDPSGYLTQSALCGPDGLECAEEAGLILPPTLLDETILSAEDGMITGISGKDFYNWYLLLFNDYDGWWWDMFGNDSDGFTVWDAIAVIMIQEAQSNWDDPNLSEAAVRAANTWCGAPKRSCTTENYINWFARYSWSAGSYISNRLIPGDPRNGGAFGFDPSDTQALNTLSRIFINHPSAWNLGCVYYRPCGWANNSASMYIVDVRQKLEDNQKALFTYNPSGLDNDPWFIPSGCVNRFWLAPNLGNPIDLNAQCPDV